MTIYKARKVSFAYYLLAAVLLFLCLLGEPTVLIQYGLYALMALFAVLGYRTAVKYSRCPKCGHVIQVGLYKITRCNYCNHAINENTVFTYDAP